MVMKHASRFLLAIFLMFAAGSLAACSEDDPVQDGIEGNGGGSGSGNGGESNGDEGGNDGDNEDESMNRNIMITVNGTAFAATLADNAAAEAFAAMLPLTLEMDELNGNEKYYYLDSSLPTDSFRPGTIRTGDLMLYGSSCIVLFYETFSSGYSYTRLGQIDNPEGLADALGSGNVSVSFTITENPD